MTAVGARSAVALAIAVAVVAFVVAFAVTRGAAGGSDGRATEPVRELPAPVVAIDNLERGPTVKPLRSLAGEPAP